MLATVVVIGSTIPAYATPDNSKLNETRNKYAEIEAKIADIQDKIYDLNEQIEPLQVTVEKTRKENSNELNNTLSLVTMWPRCIINIIMWIFRKLDYYGLVPKSISDTDPNYSTVLLSNLGSIKANCCYHHLNNYGTNSVVSTIGVIKEKNVLDKQGKVKTRKYVDISFTLDERIADGIYFAKSIRLLKYILENPKLLEDELSTKIEIEESKKN